MVKSGKSALIMVPEISLTPQTVQRFKSRFAELPSSVAVLHSLLSDGERFDEWHAIRSGKARIVIGPRSAVFAPLQNLGLVIVDEEHDASYKQESSPRYHGGTWPCCAPIWKTAPWSWLRHPFPGKHP